MVFGRFFAVDPVRQQSREFLQGFPAVALMCWAYLPLGKRRSKLGNPPSLRLWAGMGIHRPSPSHVHTRTEYYSRSPSPFCLYPVENYIQRQRALRKPWSSEPPQDLLSAQHGGRWGSRQPDNNWSKRGDARVRGERIGSAE